MTDFFEVCCLKEQICFQWPSTSDCHPDQKCDWCGLWNPLFVWMNMPTKKIETVFCVCASESKIPIFIFILCKRFWLEPLSLGWSDIGHIQTAMMPTVMPSQDVIIVLKALNEMLGLSSAFLLRQMLERLAANPSVLLDSKFCSIYNLAFQLMFSVLRMKVSFSFICVKHNIYI